MRQASSSRESPTTFTISVSKHSSRAPSGFEYLTNSHTQLDVSSSTMPSRSPSPMDRSRSRTRSPSPRDRSRTQSPRRSPTARSRSPHGSRSPRSLSRSRSRTRSPTPRRNGRRSYTPDDRSRSRSRSRTRSPNGRGRSYTRSPTPRDGSPAPRSAKVRQACLPTASLNAQVLTVVADCSRGIDKERQRRPHPRDFWQVRYYQGFENAHEPSLYVCLRPCYKAVLTRQSM